MTRIRQAVLGALALASSQAVFAIPQGTTLDAIVGSNTEFFIGGSSALDNDISKTLGNFLCADTMDTFEDIVGTVKGGFWKAYSCTLKAAGTYTVGSTQVTIPTSLGGQGILVHKREKEGSLYGSVPVALNGYVEFLNLKQNRASGLCVADGANTYDCTVSGVLTNRDLPRHDPAHGGKTGETVNDDECDYNTVATTNPIAVVGTPDTLCRRSTLGLSDTEAEMFIGSNTNPRPNASDTVDIDDFPSGGLPATSRTGGSLASLTRKRVAGQVFGVIVSQNVLQALQTAQGLTVGNEETTDGLGTNWPSLGSDQIRQILSGTVSQWSQVVGGISLTGTANDIAVCRRDQGSGTQATINQYFFNYPCDTTNGTPQRDTGGLGVTTGSSLAPGLTGSGVLYVQEGFSGTVVKNCMTAAQAGTLPGTTTGSTQAYGALGILNTNGEGSAGSWAWVKVDGVAPLLKNAILGKYDLWVEFQESYNPTNQSANETSFVTMLESALGNPDVMTAVGDAGIGAMTYNGWTWNDGTNNSNIATAPDLTVTDPVMGGNHGGIGASFPAAGTSPISCRKIRNQTENSNPPLRIS